MSPARSLRSIYAAPAPRRALRPAAVALAAAAVVLASAGCGAKAEQRRPRVPVTVATAERRPMPDALSATGTVEAIRTAEIGAQVGGVVTRVAFREGDEVVEGQLLFQLDPRPFRAALDQAQSALQRDRAQASIARANAERARATFEQKLISQAEWDQSRATAETWAATVLADSAAAQTARLNLEYASVRAPISGRTGRQLVHEGDLVRSGSGIALVTINQTRPVRVAFTVPGTSAALVQRYRASRPRVEVRSSPSDSAAIAGTLTFVDNAVDATSGTLLLKGEFDNRDGRLIAGQFVDVRLVLRVQQDAIVVPETAVTSGQQGSFVYVLQPDSTVASRPVVVERTVEQLVVVGSGLAPGEVVITDGQLRLSPGARVQVRNASGANP